MVAETNAMACTAELVAYLVASHPDDIPAVTRHEGKRALVNIVGCALGGARHEAMDITIAALGSYAGPPTCQVLGRTERFDPLLASLLNGVSSHVHDFDDTMPRNYIHASSPVASALLAYASVNAVSGHELLHAFILGFEVVARIGNATYPAHYEAGWHSTGSIGVFGAAAGVGKLLGLDATQMTYAIGLAATQAAGLREMFGSMGKAFHPGRSAQSGYMAALLAQKGFTSGRLPLEAPRGFAAVTAGHYDLAKVTNRLGLEFELHANTYKPFPCGIVIHPTIDAMIQLRGEHGIKAEDVRSVQLRVAPIVKDLCDKKRISGGLEGKFSIYHAVAIGLGRGSAGLEDFSDEAVNDPALVRLREVTEPISDPTVGEDAVVASVTLNDGRVLQKSLEGSIGNLKRPLSDAQLDAKFLGQAIVLAPGERAAALAACWGVEALANASELVSLCVPDAR